jgi:hypothetical protein
MPTASPPLLTKPTKSLLRPSEAPGRAIAHAWRSAVFRVCRSVTISGARYCAPEACRVSRWLPRGGESGIPKPCLRLFPTGPGSRRTAANAPATARAGRLRILCCVARGRSCTDCVPGRALQGDKNRSPRQGPAGFHRGFLIRHESTMTPGSIALQARGANGDVSCSCACWLWITRRLAA